MYQLVNAIAPKNSAQVSSASDQNFSSEEKYRQARQLYIKAKSLSVNQPFFYMTEHFLSRLKNLRRVMLIGGN